MHVFEIKHGELLAGVTAQAKTAGIANGAIVSLIGAVDRFTLSTMPQADATRDVISQYEMPAEMTGTGEITDGAVHIHAVMAVEGDRAISGHLHEAHVETWFARVYVIT